MEDGRKVTTWKREGLKLLGRAREGSYLKGEGSYLDRKGSNLDRKGSNLDGKGSYLDGKGSYLDGKGSNLEEREEKETPGKGRERSYLEE